MSDLFNLQKNMPLFGYMIPKKWLVFFTEKIKSDASKIKLLGISQTKYCMIKDAVTFFFCVVQGNCIVLLCNVGFHPSFVKAAFLVLVILEYLRQLFLFLLFLFFLNFQFSFWFLYIQTFLLTLHSRLANYYAQSTDKLSSQISQVSERPRTGTWVNR